MPTKSPRLTITLDPAVAAYLRRISELTGNSQSKLIAELLEGSVPVFARLIKVLEAAEQAKHSFIGTASRDMKDAQSRLEEQLGLMLEDFDDTTAPLLEHAEAITRRGRKGTPGRASDTSGTSRPPSAQDRSKASQEGFPTPLSNRGVRSHKSTTKPIAAPDDQAKPTGRKHHRKVQGVE